MSFWKFVNAEETQRVAIKDNDGNDTGEWLDLKANISKGDMNSFLESAPSLGDTSNVPVADQMNFIARYGETVTMGWSATDSNGNPIAFSISEYLSLEARVASMIDRVWSEHLATQMGTGTDALEKKQETSDTTSEEVTESQND